MTQAVSAAVAAVCAAEQKGQAAGLGASGTKEWLRRRATKQTRLKRAVGNTPAAELHRSKQLMKCMPELPEDQLGAGQVAHCSGGTLSHSPTRGEMTGADSVASAHLLTEVSADEPTADKFDQLVSDKSIGESDSDDGLQARDLPLHKEDDFDADGLR